MSARTFLLLIAVVFLLAACDGSDTAGTGAQSAGAFTQAAQQRLRKQKQQQRQQQGQKQTSVFTPLTSTIDRAKSVQTTVDQQAAKQRKLIEKESQ